MDGSKVFKLQTNEGILWAYLFPSTTRSEGGVCGKSCLLSDITQLTRAKIPFPERFDEMIDYKQNEVIQDLQTKDLLCTK